MIPLYELVCKHSREQVGVYCQRFSPFMDLTFTDEEGLGIYRWGGLQKQREIKDIYDHTRRHLSAWFPPLPSEGGYVQRLNRGAGVFAPLLELLQQTCPRTGVLEHIRLLDSLPIKLAHAKRSSRAQVVPAIANQGDCSSKDQSYAGVKVPLLGLRRPGTLPRPEYIGLTPASEHDLAAFRQIAPELYGGELYLDKAYIDELLRQLSQTEQDLTRWTPVKKAKGHADLDPFDQGLSTAVSRVRQPIESLLNWLEEKTGIPRAAQVRSYNGL